MPFRLIGIFAFQLEHFFLTRDFPIFSSSSSSFFFFIFFLSHRPSALKKRGKGLIFTPNISTGDVGVHRHQAIVPFLLYDTTTNHWAFNFTLLNDAILQLPRLSAYALQYIALIPLFPSLQLLAASTATSVLSLVSYGVVRLRISHNELPAGRVFLILFTWSCCCSHYLSSIGEYILCLQNPLSLHNLKTMLKIGRYS